MKVEKNYFGRTVIKETLRYLNKELLKGKEPYQKTIGIYKKRVRWNKEISWKCSVSYLIVFFSNTSNESSIMKETLVYR